MTDNTTESVPYNGEESELREVLEDIIDTNSTKIVIRNVLENVFNNTQLVTDQDGTTISEQVWMVFSYVNNGFEYKIIIGKASLFQGLFCLPTNPSICHSWSIWISLFHHPLGCYYDGCGYLEVNIPNI